MNQVKDVLDGIAEVVAAVLPEWNRYVGYVEAVTVPAFIVCLPDSITYEGLPAGRGDFTVKLTGAVDTTDAVRLMEFLSTDSVAGQLQGARYPDAWWGDLNVTEASDPRLASNGSGKCLAIDLILRFIA